MSQRPDSGFAKPGNITSQRKKGPRKRDGNANLAVDKTVHLGCLDRLADRVLRGHLDPANQQLHLEQAQVISIPVHIVTKQELPVYAHPGDAGFDLVAAISKPVTIYPGHREVIPTGIKVAIPDGYELQIRSRSGMTRNYGVIVANSPGTIDCGYRGEVGVILANIDEFDSFTVQPGMKIAQGVLSPVVQAEFIKVESLGETERGEGGFGSSGV